MSKSVVKLTKSVVEALKNKVQEYDVNDSQIMGFHVRLYRCPSKMKTFYFTYRNSEDKRKRVKIGVFGQLSMQQARDKAQEYSGKVAAGIDVQQEKKDSGKKVLALKDITLEKFISEKYEPWAVGRYKTGQESVDKIEAGFKSLLHFYLGDISHSIIDDWRTEQLERGLKRPTVNRIVNALRGALSRAVEWELISKHPLKKLKDFKIDSKAKVRFLTKEENRRLMASLTARDEQLKQARERGNEHKRRRGNKLLPSLTGNTFSDRVTPMVLLSLNTGMRQGEVFDLTWQDVIFEHKYITIVGDIAKSWETRHIPLNATSYNALESWKKQTEGSGRVFPADDGGRLDNVRKSWATLKKSAKITSFRWHDMRHDFASQLVMRGVHLNTVRELCGHKTLEQTQRYAHLAPGHKSEAVALLE